LIDQIALVEQITMRISTFEEPVVKSVRTRLLADYALP